LCVKKFKDGREGVINKEKSDHLTTSGTDQNIEELTEMVISNTFLPWNIYSNASIEKDHSLAKQVNFAPAPFHTVLLVI
jgi:hypothetical protein